MTGREQEVYGLKAKTGVWGVVEGDARGRLQPKLKELTDTMQPRREARSMRKPLLMVAAFFVL